MEMGEESFQVVLETNRVEIVQRLQLDRTFLFDYLRSKAVFDGGDCDLVHSEKTREQKAGKFLDVLLTKGENGYSHFIDAIQLLNPWLYEKVTGEKSTARPNPIMIEGKENFFLGGLEGSGHIPDLDIMSNHLKRTTSDLQDITLRYDSILKEKEQLERRLSRASSDLQVKHRRVEELERQKSDTETLLLETHSSAKKAGEGAVQHYNTMSRELNERNNYIIALQMRLLSAQEEVENMKNKVEESTQQKEAILGQFKEVSKNYDHQRRESMQLSVKLEHQKDNIQKAEELKVKFRQLQFVNQKLKAEKEESMKELNELKIWTEALKARYDIVEEDFRQTQESHESAVADCSTMRERTDELEIKLTISKREVDDLKNRCKDLEQAANTYREQRELYEKAWKESSVERDQSRKEREDAIERLAEVIRSRDEAINRQMELSKQFEQQHKKTVEELHAVRESLARTEIELEDLRKAKLERTPSDVSENTFTCTQKYVNGNGLHLDTEKAMEVKLKSIEDLESGSPTDSEDSYDWNTRRKTSNIIDSLKKRVGKRKPPSTGSQTESFEEERTTTPTPTIPSTPEKSLSLDEKLEELVPEKKALSIEAQKCLSMDRNNVPFKTNLPYGTLECMFGQSMKIIASTASSFESRFSNLPSLRSVENEVSSPSTRKLSGSDAYESGEDKVSGKNQKLSSPEKGPKRPHYPRSESLPSSIQHFVQTQEPESRFCVEKTAAVGETEGSSTGELKRRSLKEVSNAASYNKISNLTLYNTPLIDLKNQDENNREIAEALMSPTLKQPFRERSGAVTLSDDERPRSISAPESPSSSDEGSGERAIEVHSQ